MRRGALVRALTPPLLAGWLCGAGCPEDDPVSADPSEARVDLSWTDFTANHPFFAYYELWVVFELDSGESRRASAGRFKADAVGAPLFMNATSLAIATDADVPRTSTGSPDWEKATLAFVTLEADSDMDSEPNLPAFVAGEVVSRRATLKMNHPAAVNRTFDGAAGSFVLATPTTATDLDESMGLWFALPGGVGAGVTLPELAPGFRYEGWVNIAQLGDFSLGTFQSVNGADSDGTGPLPPEQPGWAFPGSDFPTAGQNPLTLGQAFISLEPPGNVDGAKPFFTTLLIRPLEDDPTGVSLPLQNVAPSPTISLTFGGAN